MKTNNNDKGWGLYLIASLIVSALTLGILIYIGWFNGRTHVDSPNSNIMVQYPAQTGNPNSPGENDWLQIGRQPLKTIITAHATQHK